MINGNIAKLVHYIDSEISKVTALDAGADKKGSAAQTAKAKKEGYLEGLRNVRKVIQDNIPLR
jgi:hypothetical protein